MNQHLFLHIYILIFEILQIIEGSQIESDTSSADFYSIVKDETFVDKTLLIKDIFSPPAVKLITAPSKFGKSTNMNMIKTFLQIVVDEKGVPIETVSSKNYKLFKDNNLLITKQKLFFNEHFGKYPVLFIDCKPLSVVNSFDNLLNTYRTILHKTFSEHKYLVHNASLWLDDDAKKEFVLYIDPIFHRNLTKIEITNGFLYLSRLLCAHFGKQIYVLMDDYDAYIKSMIFEEPEDSIVTFVQSVNTALLQPNKYVEGALLTGVLRATGKGLTLPESNVKDYCFMDNHTFSSYYGLTEDEIETILCKVVKDEKERNKTKNTILEYYNGYTINRQNTQVYNIMSVLKYLKTKQLKVYWNLPIYRRIFQKVFTSPDMFHIMQELLYGNTMEIDISDPLSEKDILMLNHIVSSGVVQSTSRMQVFMVFLYHSGYLSLARVFDEFETTLKIPNEEIKYQFAKTIATIYTSLYRFHSEHIRNFQTIIDSFQTQGDNTKHFTCFHETVNALFNTSSFQQESESDYQSILYVYILSKPEYSHTKTLIDSEASDSLLGHAYLSLRTRHGIDIYIKVKGSIAIEDDERPKKAERSVKQIVNNTLHGQVDRESQYKIFIGICFDLDMRSSIAYTYFLKKSDNLENITIIP